MSPYKVGSEVDEQIAVLSNDSDVRIYNPKDPYDTPSERDETSDFIFNTFFFWTGAGGTFSTWRERHIFLRGFYNGFNTELQGKFSACPTMWEDEAQYYEAGQEAGYLLKAGVIAAAGGSGITLTASSLLPMLLKLIGM
jgi:hypothetical protein